MGKHAIDIGKVGLDTEIHLFIIRQFSSRECQRGVKFTDMATDFDIIFVRLCQIRAKGASKNKAN